MVSPKWWLRWNLIQYMFTKCPLCARHSEVYWKQRDRFHWLQSRWAICLLWWLGVFNEILNESALELVKPRQYVHFLLLLFKSQLNFHITYWCFPNSKSSKLSLLDRLLLAILISLEMLGQGNQSFVSAHCVKFECVSPSLCASIFEPQDRIQISIGGVLFPTSCVTNLFELQYLCHNSTYPPKPLEEIV